MHPSPDSEGGTPSRTHTGTRLTWKTLPVPLAQTACQPDSECHWHCSGSYIISAGLPVPMCVTVTVTVTTRIIKVMPAVHPGRHCNLKTLVKFGTELYVRSLSAT